MLVGYKDNKTEFPDNINLLFVRKFMGFFIAPNESHENHLLAKSIRKTPLAEINLIVEDVEKRFWKAHFFNEAMSFRLIPFY